ncbi:MULTISPECIES: IucA/IucC family protein [Streptomyces]|uniref:Siderophore synthetase component n=1 Tax=Streptomyces nymphaeiformis TaxID=2663842 RepID=A0A7W7TU31_9ACTN|nr:IucA/IucC family C-terminal-domain containing protein [Streptomyces nymphaeiformis]MBB4979373.1 siderophore synthetase component [Streptomyces nymphaeiformis]
MSEAKGRADALSATALLNCLIREVAGTEPRPDPDHTVHRLPATGRLLRVRAGRRPTEPCVRTDGGWLPLTFEALVALTADELGRRTGVTNRAVVGEMTASRDVVAALQDARASASPPEDPYLRSEQALLAGHRYHPAPKARGAGVPESWLPYAPEAYARFPLELLGVRADVVAEDGDLSLLDALGTGAPDGYLLLPVHPWELDLLGEQPAFRDGRLLRLGASAPSAGPAVATSSVRTVYLPDADLFCKFSLDVQITNGNRRLELRDLLWLRTIADLLAPVFDPLPTATFLADRGYRTADLGGQLAYEGFAVIAREGLRPHLLPGVTPLLAAGVAEGFPGNPIDGLTAEGALAWWRHYLDRLVPPVLHAWRAHGLVLECHLQNVLVGVDADGLPAQVVFRDHEGIRIVAARHRGLLDRHGPRGPAPALDAEHGWERLVYCLVTNNLSEIAGALTDRHPELTGELWSLARSAFAAYAAEHGGAEEVSALLGSPHVPAKTNLLLRWLDVAGADARYVPMPNPLRRG